MVKSVACLGAPLSVRGPWIQEMEQDKFLWLSKNRALCFHHYSSPVGLMNAHDLKKKLEFLGYCGKTGVGFFPIFRFSTRE